MPKKGIKANLRKKVKKSKAKTRKSSVEMLSVGELFNKYNICLGRKGYIPSSSDGISSSSSIYIDSFSMVDPGGGCQLLTNTKLDITENNIYGLVGKNGDGKSTLLKLMYNYEIDGFPLHIIMMIVNQEELISNECILECILKSDKIREELIKTEDRLILMREDTENEEIQNELDEILDIMRSIYIDSEYNKSEKKALKILNGLGFTKEMIENKKVNELSGGWQMRLKLVRALFVEPDLMLLDEPTNHLDFSTVLWLQNYLKQYNKTVIIISHDRTFLNNTCKSMIHLTQNKLLYFNGNYDKMIETEKIHLNEQWRKYKSVINEIGDIKKWLKTFQDNKKFVDSVKSRKKKLSTLEIKAASLKPARNDKELQFEFPDVCKLEEYVCLMENVSFKYNKMRDMLLSAINMRLDTDSRIGMIGSNGIGKSTIIKLIMNDEIPLIGECRCNRQVRIAYFTQYHIDQLDLEQSAVQFICNKFKIDYKSQSKIGKIRGRLGRFRLSGDEHTKKMKYLSGGQRSRIAFCICSWNEPHFLIMDEPTNHLDIETIDALINAIKSFNGGCLIISHDQYFLKNVVNQYWTLTKNGIKSFHQFENAKLFALNSLNFNQNDIKEQEEEYKTNDNKKDKKKKNKYKKNNQRKKPRLNNKSKK